MDKWSNFHITVNFNKRDYSLVPAVRDAIERMAVDPDVWRWLKRYDNERKQQVDFEGGDQADIHRIRIRAAFEDQGEHNRGVHVHVLVEVYHSTLVQIDKRELIGLFEEVVGAKPNVHCRFLRGDGESKDFILHYISKEVPQGRAKDPQTERLRVAFAAGREEVEAEY